MGSIPILDTVAHTFWFALGLSLWWRGRGAHAPTLLSRYAVAPWLLFCALFPVWYVDVGGLGQETRFFQKNTSGPTP
jgi:hypothetical protein